MSAANSRSVRNDSKSKRNDFRNSASKTRTSNKRAAAKNWQKKALQRAALYRQQAVTRKYFCTWIERFIERLREREANGGKLGIEKALNATPDPINTIPSTRAAAEQIMIHTTHAHSDSRMSLPARSMQAPAPADSLVHKNDSHQYGT